NGPAFACGVAERLGISQVYVFDLGSVFSAFGSSISDIVHVYEHGLNVSLAAVEGQRKVREVIERMHTEALHDMKGEGFSPGGVFQIRLPHSTENLYIQGIRPQAVRFSTAPGQTVTYWQNGCCM